MNIIEKLGITPIITEILVQDGINPVYSINELTPQIRELEQRQNRLIYFLIGFIDLQESLCIEYGINKNVPAMQDLENAHDLLTEIDPKHRLWEETKELINGIH
jgi:hypothetical protein